MAETDNLHQGSGLDLHEIQTLFKKPIMRKKAGGSQRTRGEFMEGQLWSVCYFLIISFCASEEEGDTLEL